MAAGLLTLFALELLLPETAPPPAALAMAVGFGTLAVVSLLSRPAPLPEPVRLTLTL